MSQIDSRLSTGLPGLDRTLTGLIPGDNIVWQINSVDDYRPFAEPFCKQAVAGGQPLIYFRFARHAPLTDAESGAQVHQLHPEAGFEQCITEIHNVIRSVGHGGYYLFDCLSDLAVDWYSDQMLGNFFMLTCPHLYDNEAVAYFAILHDRHSYYAIAPIGETTQILVDVLRHEGMLYVHPQKVQHRYSPTMFVLHAFRDGDFVPVTDSATVTSILRSAPWQGLGSGRYRLGVWGRQFLHAQETLTAMGETEARRIDGGEYFRRLLRMAISRDDRMLALAEEHLSLADVLEIDKRMIGTGLIGGKSVGMLLARAILQKADPKWRTLLEPHDSFYIGSDVFYTFLVRNGLWWARQQQRDPATFLEGAATARQRILTGTFPEHIGRQFTDMLDYFGQSPIIIRSSSLLEDNFGNAFAGKYESIFCVNQGPRDKRLADFISAVRQIYASAMSREALMYRAQRGMLERDEQMALLVQRVSGDAYDRLFYPQIAGVGLSFNPYCWSKEIDPEAGVLRLVFGLGTRAVDRYDDDYTRVVALNAPQRRPEASFDEVRQFTQRMVDVLDLAANQQLTRRFADVSAESPGLKIDLFASRDETIEQRAADAGIKDAPLYILTFEKLLSETDLVADMRRLLARLQEAYQSPVDVEFTANFHDDGRCQINLLQCRPFQGTDGGRISDPPEHIPAGDILFEARGAVIGRSRQSPVDRIIYVVPSVYAKMRIQDRHETARLIGRIAHLPRPRGVETTMLLGPGRWGTTSPSLGVPIRFGEISEVSILCEIVAMHEGLVPEVSLGTHLFNDMVEMDLLYTAVFPEKEGNRLNEPFFLTAPNRLATLLPAAAKWADAIRVIDMADLDAETSVILNANARTQRAVCYLHRPGGPAPPPPIPPEEP